MPRPTKRQTQDRSPEPGAYLTILDGRQAGSQVPIGAGLTIGRTADNRVAVHDPGVSRRHAQVRCEGGLYTLADLGSANGTLLNDTKISGVEVLRDGDVILVGGTGVSFHAPDESRPLLGESTRLASSGEVDGEAAATDPGAVPEAVRSQRRHRRAPVIVTATLCLAALLAAGTYKLLQRTRVIGPADLSGEILEFEDNKEFFNRSFGDGRFDTQHPSMASFSFTYLRGRVTVEYGAWGVETAGEVAIAVNGDVIGSVQPTGGIWRYGMHTELPRNLLRNGPGNVVSFRQTRGDTWEVGYVRIRQDPLLPPNPAEADGQMQLARKLHEDRDVEPANLWNAMLKYRLAADLLELQSPRPDTYGEALQMVDRINEELNDLFHRGRFSAEREYRFGNVDAARDYVRRTIAHFPDRRDVRYQELATYLEALDAEAQ